MKTIFTFHFIFFLFLFSTYSSSAQSNFYKITNQGNKYTNEELATSISKGDWCGYFHVESHYQLKFDDGAVVELLSKKELGSTEFDENCFQNEKTEDPATYKIHESGIIIRMVSARNTSKN